MTREEAIEVVKERLDYYEREKRLRAACEILIPELRKSEEEKIIQFFAELATDACGGPGQEYYEELGLNYNKVMAWLEKHKECVVDSGKTSADEDEKIRKELIEKISNLACGCFISQEQKQNFIAYLEKQKYDRMKPIYDNQDSFESALEKAWNDYHNGYENVDRLEDDYVECAHAKGFREGYLFGIEKQKEQKPILEVFGFKVGDAVRLKDGDGRKHIIKSFEEVEGLHGPNFYYVEFEDNSARDGIYPGEEYPNGYYTQMEKLEKLD